MIRQSVLLLLLVTFYASLQTQCISKCISEIKGGNYRDCLKIYNQGKVIHKCSIKTMKTDCRVQCQKGNTCSEDCRETLCGQEKRTICKKVCHNKGSQECKDNCTWRNEKSCVLDRFPGQWFSKCQWIVNDEKFKLCVTSCSKPIKSKTCIETCSKVELPKQYSGCLKQVQNSKTRCSVPAFAKKCKKMCQKKRCFLETNETLCNGKRIRQPSWTCSNGKVCQEKCLWSLQEKCYMEKIDTVDTCNGVFGVEKLKTCLKKCFIKFK